MRSVFQHQAAAERRLGEFSGLGVRVQVLDVDCRL